MNGNHKSVLFLITFVAGLTLFTTGCVDIDWMVVQYRYSEWHRSLTTWEFCPWFKMGWWDAYLFTLLRIIVGTALLAALATYITLTMKAR